MRLRVLGGEISSSKSSTRFLKSPKSTRKGMCISPKDRASRFLSSSSRTLTRSSRNSIKERRIGRVRFARENRHRLPRGRCCPSGCVDAYEIAEELDKRYFGNTLSRKFKFGVTGCSNNCLKAEENDLGVNGAWKFRGTGRITSDAAPASGYAAISLVDGKIVIDKDKRHRCGKCARLCPKKAINGKPGFVVSFAPLPEHLATTLSSERISFP